MSNEQLKSEIQAWVNGADRYQQNLQSHLDYATNEIMKAVEKYAEIKAKDAWSRACEAQRRIIENELPRNFIMQGYLRSILNYNMPQMAGYYISDISNLPKPEYKP